jgi:sulfate transport system ATP-binding protein
LQLDAVQDVAGPQANLYIRPQDVEIGDAQDALPARIVSLRRSGATRRAEIAIEGAEGLIEIETPAAAVLHVGDEIPVRLLRGRMFPPDRAAP